MDKFFERQRAAAIIYDEQVAVKECIEQLALINAKSPTAARQSRIAFFAEQFRELDRARAACFGLATPEEQEIADACVAALGNRFNT